MTAVKGNSLGLHGGMPACPLSCGTEAAEGPLGPHEEIISCCHYGHWEMYS